MAIFGKGREPAPDTIDLREPAPAAKAPDIVFGQPAPCPDCGHPGYLDSIDPHERSMYQHCVSCGARWVIFEADIVAAAKGDLTNH